MKIVHIISTLNIGGAENFVVQLANAQAQTHSVILIVLQTSNPNHNYLKTVSDTIQVIPLHWKKKYSVSQFIQGLIYVTKRYAF